jgi:putative tryptophan/tyrosine transport system substrate-binding protein
VSREARGVSAEMKKKIIGFALTLSVLLFALCATAQAQQSAKVAKIGWLGALPAASDTGSKLFARELSKLGYVEGKNFELVYRFADNRLDRLPALADEMVRLNVNVIVTPSDSQALAAKNATRTVPIVFYSVGDPVAIGLVDSLGRPGRNITGFSNMSPVLAGKRLEILKETVPKLSRVALLWDPEDPGSRINWKEIQLPARDLGLQLHSVELSSTDKVDAAFKEVAKSGGAALVVASASLFTSIQKRIIELAAKNRLPAIYGRGDWTANGGLMSYSADRDEPYRRAAAIVDKILKGTKPEDIPVEQPVKFEFIVNLKAAKQIGLTIPPNVLARADKVIR